MVSTKLAVFYVNAYISESVLGNNQIDSDKFWQMLNPKHASKDIIHLGSKSRLL